MAERLESYDEQNIEELTAEKSKARNLGFDDRRWRYRKY